MLDIKYICKSNNNVCKTSNEIKEPICIELKLCIVVLKGGDIHVCMYTCIIKNNTVQ